jgi:predicted transcriptional regulator
MADVLDVLGAIKESERSTKALMETFSDWSDRAFASSFLGNMRSVGLIQRRSNGYWALTKKGRERLEGVSDLGKKDEAPEQIPVEEPVNEKVTVVSDWEKGIRDTSRKTESDEKTEPVSAFDMARRLQHEIPNGSSLVIEADEVFLAWRGARFSIQKPEDLQAFKAIQEAYIGEVA